MQQPPTDRESDLALLLDFLDDLASLLVAVSQDPRGTLSRDLEDFARTLTDEVGQLMMVVRDRVSVLPPRDLTSVGLTGVALRTKLDGYERARRRLSVPWRPRRRRSQRWVWIWRRIFRWADITLGSLTVLVGRPLEAVREIKEVYEEDLEDYLSEPRRRSPGGLRRRRSDA